MIDCNTFLFRVEYTSSKSITPLSGLSIAISRSCNRRNNDLAILRCRIAFILGPLFTPASKAHGGLCVQGTRTCFLRVVFRYCYRVVQRVTDLLKALGQGAMNPISRPLQPPIPAAPPQSPVGLLQRSESNLHGCLRPSSTYPWITAGSQISSRRTIATPKEPCRSPRLRAVPANQQLQESFSSFCVTTLLA